MSGGQGLRRSFRGGVVRVCMEGNWRGQESNGTLLRPPGVGVGRDYLRVGWGESGRARVRTRNTLGWVKSTSLGGVHRKSGVEIKTNIFFGKNCPSDGRVGWE
eukprot:765229-Hanusia_phi.AAC.2